jgi:hypothetical protein
MKKSILIIGAVVIVLFIGYLYVTPEGSGEITTDFGNLEVVVEFTTADGETIDVTKDFNDDLTVTSPDGVVVTSVTTRLKASFSTSTEEFENVEFYLAPETNPPSGWTPDDSTDDSRVSIIIGQGGGVPPVYMAETYPEQTVFSISDYSTPVRLLGSVIYFDDIFDYTDPSGSYTFEFHFVGEILYRGGSDSKGWSDWEVVTLSDEDVSGSAALTYAGPDVEIEWDTEVIWS